MAAGVDAQHRDAGAGAALELAGHGRERLGGPALLQDLLEILQLDDGGARRVVNADHGIAVPALRLHLGQLLGGEFLARVVRIIERDRLRERHALARVRIRHADQNGRSLRAQNRLAGLCLARGVIARQNARAVELIHRVVAGVPRAHVRNRALRDLVDRLQRLGGEGVREQDGEERARDGGVVVRARGVENAVLQRVVHIDLIPRLALHEGLAARLIDAVHSGRERDALGDGQLPRRREGVLRHAADQTEARGLRHVSVIPCLLRHVDEAPVIGRLLREILQSGVRQRGRSQQRRQQQHRQNHGQSSFHRILPLSSVLFILS